MMMKFTAIPRIRKIRTMMAMPVVVLLMTFSPRIPLMKAEKAKEILC